MVNNITDTSEIYFAKRKAFFFKLIGDTYIIDKGPFQIIQFKVFHQGFYIGNCVNFSTIFCVGLFRVIYTHF